MAYAIRKSPKQKLYRGGYSKKTEKKFSKKPNSRERAEAQRRAIYASENGYKYKKRSRFISKKSKKTSRSRKYVKKSLSPRRLRGGGYADDQLKYIKDNLYGLLTPKPYSNSGHIIDFNFKPIYDLFLWNNKDFEKVYVELYDLNTNKNANLTKIQLDYYGDFLRFAYINDVRLCKDSPINLGLFIIDNEKCKNQQFLRFILNERQYQKINIPVLKGLNGEYEIGGECYIFSNRKKFTFRSPVVSASLVKSILIDYFAVDSRTGTTKAVADQKERIFYILNKLLKDWQNSINTTGKFIITDYDFDKYSYFGFFENVKNVKRDVFTKRPDYGLNLKPYYEDTRDYYETIQPPPTSLFSMLNELGEKVRK